MPDEQLRNDLADERTDLAGERTHLAAERTQLAWWRTGLTSIAVGIGVGRILPVLDPGVKEWPYMALGVAFVLYGVILMMFGNTLMAKSRDPADPSGTGPAVSKVISSLGIILGLATVLVILFAR